ncbi:MAG: hypothetical protein WBV69_08770 [Candidatus Sulfotelmatobacter sp.]
MEIAKLRQFVYATLNMVPNERRAAWQNNIDISVGRSLANATSLAESIRRVIKEAPRSTFTAKTIRRDLIQRGFDFSKYKSNPLSSISTTLRRMVEARELVEGKTASGGAMFMTPDSEYIEIRKEMAEIAKAKEAATSPKKSTK